MKKRILHIGTSGGRGGIESFILNMSSQMDSEKYSFSIIADCEKAIIEDDFGKIGEMIYIPAIKKSKLGYLKVLWRAVDKKKFDVVHIHKNSLSNPLPVLICKMKGIKNIILHSHNTMPADGRASVTVHKIFRKFLNIFSLRRLACSELAAEWMFGKNYKKKNVTVVNNAIDAEMYKFTPEKRNEIRRTLGLEDTFVLGNVGRFAEQKNHKFIIEVLKAIKDDSVKLMLIGDGPLMNEVKEYSRQLGVEDRIMFMGIRDDVHELMQAMDLFIFPSKYEGLGIVAIEAQATGLPVLASDKVPTEAKITDNLDYLPIDDASVWCERIKEIRNGYVRRNTTDEIVHAKYDYGSFKEQINAIYSELC